MTGKLTRLSKSILDQPQFITPERFEEIADILTTVDRSQLYSEAIKAEKEGGGNQGLDLAETNVGVLRIEGALTNKPTMFGALCGLTSYQELIEQAEELVQMENINTIMMLQDSGGGEAFNMFDASMRVKELCNNAGKKLVAYVDGISASASYGWSAVADEIIVHPNAMVGSIGVVVRLTNTNKAEKDLGIETTYITAGASKVPFDKEGEFREDFKQDLQDRVDELYLGFVSHVAKARGISEDSVMDTEAKMFSANKAVELGLVDKIMNNEQFYTYLADLSNDDKEEDIKPSKATVIKLEQDDNSSNLTTQSEKETLMSDPQTPELSVDTAKLAEFDALKEKLEGFEAMQSKLAEFEAKEKAQAQASLSESLNAYTFASEDKEQLLAFLSNDKVEAEHKSLLNTVLEKAQASIGEVTEQAATSIAEAQAETEKAQAQKEKLKSEFGETVIASTEQPEEALDLTAQLKAKVAQKKAAQAAKA